MVLDRAMPVQLFNNYTRGLALAVQQIVDRNLRKIGIEQGCTPAFAYAANNIEMPVYGHFVVSTAQLIDVHLQHTLGAACQAYALLPDGLCGFYKKRFRHR